jgi:hypothetical protein
MPDMVFKWGVKSRLTLDIIYPIYDRLTIITSRKSTMEKRAFLAISTMVALLVAGLPLSVWSAGGSPVIHHASVHSTKAYPGDTMTITANVYDSSGIQSVTADMGGIEIISLSLIAGSIYDRTWQGQWLAHDTTARDYVTTNPKKIFKT